MEELGASRATGVTYDKHICASDSINPMQFAATMRGMVMLPQRLRHGSEPLGTQPSETLSATIGTHCMDR